MAKLNQMVKELRESVGQSIEGLALLLQISPEEYQRLEEDWIPPDDLLERMCTLFQWNYQEIQRMVTQSVGRNASTTSRTQTHQIEKGLFSLATHLQKQREQVGQSTEAIAILLNVSVNEYEAVEQGILPSAELLQKICSLFGWNYNEIKQKLINRHSPHLGSLPALPVKAVKSMIPKISSPLKEKNQTKHDSLALRLKTARETVGQTSEAVALLLNVSEDYYLSLENGKVPDNLMLQKICALFEWNFQEIRLLIQKSGFSPLQTVLSPQYKRGGFLTKKFDTLIEDIEEHWEKLSTEKKELLLAQIELVRDTAKSWLSS